MARTDSVFSGSVPQIYDTRLVPLIFQAYAVDLAKRVSAVQPASVLETAAGSGVVARTLAPLLGSKARYAVSDLNPAMLERAKERQPADERISWHEANALELPFEDASFDVVCCQFGVMFFPDRVAGYREALRVLKPGGTFVFNTWDRIEDNEFAHLVTETAAEIFPDDPPRFLARTPHGYHEVEQVERDLRAAGFARIQLATIAERSRAASPTDPAVAYCQGTPLRGEIEARDASRLQEVTDRAAAAIAKAHGRQAVDGKIQAHVVVASL